MRIDSHLRKWQRFHSLRARFEPSCEFELWYWSTLSGGTSLINAALHQAGITEENALFATQIPDVYAVHDGPALWHHELGMRCDLIHVGLPAIDAPLPADIDRAFQAMMTIELYRERCCARSSPSPPRSCATARRLMPPWCLQLKYGYGSRRSLLG